LAWLYGLQCLNTGYELWFQILQSIRPRVHNYNSDIPLRQILLISQILISGQQNVPLTFGESEQFAILLASETRRSYGIASNSMGSQQNLHSDRNALVQQNLHFPKRASISFFASSKAAMAVSRLTPGNCSRN
jgi:hypothetical protein